MYKIAFCYNFSSEQTTQTVNCLMEHFAEWVVLQNEELGTILLHIRLGRKESKKASQHQREDHVLKYVTAGLHGWRYIYSHKGTSTRRVAFCSGETFQVKSTKLWVSYKPWETQLYSSNGYSLIIIYSTSLWVFNLFNYITQSSNFHKCNLNWKIENPCGQSSPQMPQPSRGRTASPARSAALSQSFLSNPVSRETDVSPAAQPLERRVPGPRVHLSRGTTVFSGLYLQDLAAPWQEEVGSGLGTCSAIGSVSHLRHLGRTVSFYFLTLIFLGASAASADQSSLNLLNVSLHSLYFMYL